jgi:hypothetical protein
MPAIHIMLSFVNYGNPPGIPFYILKLMVLWERRKCKKEIPCSSGDKQGIDLIIAISFASVFGLIGIWTKISRSLPVLT